MTTPKPRKALLREFAVFSGYAIRVEFAKDLGVAAKKIKDIADVAGDVDSTAAAVTLSDGDMTSYIFIKPGSTYGTIAHEALHAVNYMMKKVGVNGDESNDENTAYHLGFVVNHIVEFRKKQTRGNRGKTKYSHRR
jgi:hypothetical protein